MSLSLSTLERVARARSDLRIGAPVVVRAPSGDAVALAAETASPDRAAALAAS
jgi:hypothetical protein